MPQTYTDELETLTRDYAKQRGVLADRITKLEDETRALQRRKLPGIKIALAAVQDAQAKLAALIEANPEQHDKPKTVTIDGIKVGLQKSKGRIEWDSPDQVIALIRKKLPAQADTLIRITESPARGALNNLTAAELKSIGCRVVDAGDQVVIKPQDGEIDKLVDRLIGDWSEMEEVAS